jgi:hypothetical protein
MKKHSMLAALLALAISGCGSSPAVSYSPPVKGGMATLPAPPPITIPGQPVSAKPVAPEPLPAVIQQSDNPKTPTNYSETLTRTLTQGVSEPPAITIPPAPDNTKYWALVAGVGMIIGAGFLFHYGWPQIGIWIGAAGVAIVIISLTVDKYGWVYCAGLLGFAVIVAIEKYRAYNKGVEHGSISPPAPTGPTGGGSTTPPSA